MVPLPRQIKRLVFSVVPSRLNAWKPVVRDFYLRLFITLLPNLPPKLRGIYLFLSFNKTTGLSPPAQPLRLPHTHSSPASLLPSSRVPPPPSVFPPPEHRPTLASPPSSAHTAPWLPPPPSAQGRSGNSKAIRVRATGATSPRCCPPPPPIRTTSSCPLVPTPAEAAPSPLPASPSPLL